MSSGRSFDPVWEEKYAAGHSQRYPWDSVVTFVFRNAPRDRPRQDVRILEVGCGTASNLWFAAREGFSVAGIDASESAIKTAKARMMEDKLAADLRVADFIAIPFDDASFDLVIDRAALCCSGRDVMAAAISEIGRVSKAGARFMFTPYADSHTSFGTGELQPDGTVANITGGSVAGAGQIYFVARRELASLLGPAWVIESAIRCEDVEMVAATSIHAEWRVVARRL